MYEIKTEILQICEAFKLGTFKSSVTLETKNGYVKTEFKTNLGTYTHFFRVKK